MARRASLRDIGRLAIALDARRLAARESLEQARKDAECAARQAEAAEARSTDAITDWQSHLAGPAFAPERAVALATRWDMLATAAAHAGAARDEARAVVEDGDAAWRLAEARLARANEDFVRVRRAAVRSIEERRALAMADRVTFSRVKR